MDCTRSHASITAYVNFRTCTYFLPKKNDSKTIYNNSFDVYNDFLCFRIVFWTFCQFLFVFFWHISLLISSIFSFLFYFLYILYFLLYFVVLIILFCSSFATFLMITTIFLYTYCYKYLLFLCKPEFFVIYMASSLLIHQNGFYNHLI